MEQTPGFQNARSPSSEERIEKNLKLPKDRPAAALKAYIECGAEPVAAKAE
jgi:hypothetical protein